MPNIIGFRGIRYNPQKIGNLFKVLAPPYDVISNEEQAKLYEDSPYNVIRLILSKCEGEEKYAKAGNTFRSWIDNEILVRDNEPSIYPYYQEFEFNGNSLKRKGFIAAVRLEDFNTKRIIPHERTFPKPKLDRLKLTLACKANLSPVFSIFSDPEGIIDRAIEDRLPNAPLLEGVYKDGVKNLLWKISDEGLISEINKLLSDRAFLIADGHHRFETALEYRNIQRGLSNVGSAFEPYEFVMMYLSRAEDGGLVINPTHRVAKNLGKLEIRDFFKALSSRFDIEEKPIDEALQALKCNEFAVINNESENVFVVSPKDKTNDSRMDLGVRNLHGKIFGEILDEEEAEIFYTKSLEEVITLVRSGEYKLGFILPPLRSTDLLELVLKDEKLPHKTTYFYPKVLSGLVFHQLF